MSLLVDRRVVAQALVNLGNVWEAVTGMKSLTF